MLWRNPRPACIRRPAQQVSTLLRIMVDTAAPPQRLAVLEREIINEPIVTSEQRDHLMDRLLSVLTKADLVVLRDRAFDRQNASASSPFLWDIPQHDYVQWNGIGANGGVGPLGRTPEKSSGSFQSTRL